MHRPPSRPVIMPTMPRLTLLLSLWLVCFTAGCHHAGVVPPGWIGTPVATAIQNDPASPAMPDQGDGPFDESAGSLEVIICYGRVLSNHTALRLQVPGCPTLFWDPGGTYKQDDPTRKRIHDVLTQNAATVDEWWRYRRDNCREPVMAVFQWNLDAEQARRLHAILLNRQDPHDPRATFEPDAGGMQCCRRASEFLMRFADGTPAVSRRYFWPHQLGEHLWTQQPDRVTVFRAQGQSMVYRKRTDSPPP